MSSQRTIPKPVTFTRWAGGYLSCDRCGSMVPTAYEDRHRKWHEKHDELHGHHRVRM